MMDLEFWTLTFFDQNRRWRHKQSVPLLRVRLWRLTLRYSSLQNHDRSAKNLPEQTKSFLEMDPKSQKISTIAYLLEFCQFDVGLIEFAAGECSLVSFQLSSILPNDTRCNGEFGDYHKEQPDRISETIIKDGKSLYVGQILRRLTFKAFKHMHFNI